MWDPLHTEKSFWQKPTSNLKAFQRKDVEHLLFRESHKLTDNKALTRGVNLVMDTGIPC